MNVNIIYSDSYLFAINKPASMHSVNIKAKEENSIVTLLEERFKDLVNPDLKECGLLNRLDYQTSGVLLVAKTEQAYIKFKALIKEHRIKKEYLAVVEGNAPAERCIKTFLGSPYRRSKRVRVYLSPTKRALPAETHFFRVSYNKTHNISLLKAETVTGRRHQVRAHAAYIGHPLVGDRLYGSKILLSELMKNRNHLNKLPEFLLHAAKVEFLHPFSSKKIIVKAVVPDYWESNIFFCDRNGHPLILR
ncbi:MAG: RluA family pseudouridine synthase [Candidatus Dadabacteria bacterium]|nr:MAG: RluA family pseudouridine synthase [Candidatus Dadabacteria bacterium]